MNNNTSTILVKGIPVTIRNSDGLINLTLLCREFGKRIDNWMRLKQTQLWLEKTKQETKEGDTSIIETVQGNHHSGQLQGTWGNISVAEKLIEWIQSTEENKKSRKESGYLYVYHDKNNNAFKIGFTVDLISREKQHKTSNPFLVLIAEYPVPSIEIEKIIHDSLIAYRIPKTTEWYVADKFVLSTVEKIVKDYA